MEQPTDSHSSESRAAKVFRDIFESGRPLVYVRSAEEQRVGRVLREAGLVEVRTDAQRRLYRLRTEPLREIDEWLAPYRAAWAERLNALEAHLDDMED